MKLRCLPFVVGCGNLAVPIRLDQVLEIFAVCGGRIGDVVVREPTLKLRLVPFVVYCWCQSDWLLESAMKQYSRRMYKDAKMIVIDA